MLISTKANRIPKYKRDWVAWGSRSSEGEKTRKQEKKRNACDTECQRDRAAKTKIQIIHLEKSKCHKSHTDVLWQSIIYSIQWQLFLYVYFGSGASFFFFNFIWYSVAFFDFVVSFSSFVLWMICLVRACMMYDSAVDWPFFLICKTANSSTNFRLDFFSQILCMQIANKLENIYEF